MKSTILIICFTAVCANIAAQNAVVLRTPAEIELAKAEDLLTAAKYAEAAKALEELLAKNPDYQVAEFYLAESYQALGEEEKASVHFAKASNAMEQLVKARPVMSSLELHKMYYRQRYAAEQKNLTRTDVMKAPVRLSSVVNSDQGDYFPMLDPTGTRLYFTSTRPDNSVAKRSMLKSKSTQKETTSEPVSKESDEDIYYIERSGESWGAPVKLPEPLNTDNNDGAACFSADGQLMVYTACGLADGSGSCDIYFSVMENGRWTAPKNMGNVVNTEFWDSQVSLSYDGSKLFFSSGRCGGYGDTDLYMVERNIIGEWGVPVNLGSAINTPFHEYAPFFSQDGKTLYFSSDGHPGFGGLDIFKTVFENGKWSTPVNMGKPLNTNVDDKFFTIGGSGEVAYFASERDGKGLDIYEIEVPEAMRPQPTIVITGTVVNSKSNEKVGAYVMVEDMDTGELIAVNKSNASTGKYLVVLPAGRTYSVSANKEGYFFYSQSFDVPLKTHYQEVVKDITLKPIEKGTRVVLNNIFFDTGKATLTPQSHLELEKAVDLLKTNPTMVIEVGGHTDNTGDDAANMKLSHDRAKSVREYLLSRNINAERVQAKGYGESNPIATNDTDEGRKANRRTEFIILDY
jgi:outer membrane protein OmpA-like peptidoglycan-associated protein